MACLYMITAPSGRSYVGYSSRDAESRFSEHVGNAKGSRTNSILHAAIRKYGAERMHVRTLLIGSEDYCFGVEDSAIKAFGTMMPNGYNMIGGGVGLTRMPESVVRRRANTLKATMARPDQKQKRSEMLASRYSETSAASKISKSLSAFYSNPENRARAAANLKSIRENPEIEEKRISAIRLASKDLDMQKRRTAASTATNRTEQRRAHKKTTSKKMWEQDGHLEKVRGSLNKRFESGLTKNGYIYPARNGSFCVKFRRNGIDYHVGTFKTFEGAVVARDKKLEEIKAVDNV